jgi:hypothetical protein
LTLIPLGVYTSSVKRVKRLHERRRGRVLTTEQARALAAKRGPGTVVRLTCAWCHKDAWARPGARFCPMSRCRSRFHNAEVVRLRHEQRAKEAKESGRQIADQIADSKGL